MRQLATADAHTHFFLFRGIKMLANFLRLIQSEAVCFQLIRWGIFYKLISGVKKNKSCFLLLKMIKLKSGCLASTGILKCTIFSQKYVILRFLVHIRLCLVLYIKIHLIYFKNFLPSLFFKNFYLHVISI